MKLIPVRVVIGTVVSAASVCHKPYPRNAHSRNSVCALPCARKRAAITTLRYLPSLWARTLPPHSVHDPMNVRCACAVVALVTGLPFSSLQVWHDLHHISRIRGRLAPFRKFFFFSITRRLSVVWLPPRENGQT